MTGSNQHDGRRGDKRKAGGTQGARTHTHTHTCSQTLEIWSKPCRPECEREIPSMQNPSTEKRRERKQKSVKKTKTDQAKQPCGCIQVCLCVLRACACVCVQGKQAAMVHGVKIGCKKEHTCFARRTSNQISTPLNAIQQRQADTQTNTQTHRQTHKHTDKHTNTHTHTDKHTHTHKGTKQFSVDNHRQKQDIAHKRKGDPGWFKNRQRHAPNNSVEHKRNANLPHA